MAQADPRDPSKGRRTIVVSDAHGHVELIQNALDHACFNPGEDFLVYGGDVVDGGAGPSGARRCLELLRTMRAQILWGNHDVAAMLDYHIDGQDWDTRPSFTASFVDEFLSRDPDAWRLAVCVQGVVIAHAGVSRDYQQDLAETVDGSGRPDPYALVDALNAEFVAAAQRQRETGRRDRDARAFARRSPHRFRPLGHDMGPDWVVSGLLQIAGHSPYERYRGGRWRRPEMEAAGLYLIDPDYHVRAGSDGFRYAVIQGGRVRVFEETRPCPRG